MKYKFLIVIQFFLLLTSNQILCQKNIKLIVSFGLADMPSFFKSINENKKGTNLEMSGIYSRNHLDIGLKFNQYTSTKIKSNGQAELEFSEDLLLLQYRDPFYQENSDKNYYTISLEGGYTIPIIKYLSIRLSSGISYISGNELKISISSPGNFETTKVAYAKHQKSEFAWQKGVYLLFHISKKMEIIASLQHQGVLNYLNCNLGLAISI